MVCTRITEWIEERVSRAVTEWVERSERECKKRRRYDPRRWFCWFVIKLVQTVRWVVVNVIKAVITIVCRAVGLVLSVIGGVARFFYLLGKALVTWDRCVLQEALAALGDILVKVVTVLHVLVDPIVDMINRHRLRSYVRDQLDARFGDRPDVLAQIKETLHLDHGVFGFRLDVKVHRMFVDSTARTERYADVPNLLGLHRDGIIDLHSLAGFTPRCALTTAPGWYRPRPQTAKFPFAGGGDGAVPPKLDEDELRRYIDSDGSRGPHFRIYAIHPRSLSKRTRTAEEEARRLGLILRFEAREVAVVHEDFIKYTPLVQPRFLKEVLGRRDRDLDPEGARLDLCAPVAVAVFGFENRRHRGYTSSLNGTRECADHNLPPDDTSGVSFIDDIPDEIRRYVLIHELGHYFGLCHVDGFSRIMVTAAEGQGDTFTLGAIAGTLTHGGPRFILDEAKQVWRYILAHFPEECLRGHDLAQPTPDPRRDG